MKPTLLRAFLPRPGLVAGLVVGLVASFVIACRPAGPPVDEAVYSHEFDLLEHWDEAILHHETRRIDFGTPEARAFIRQGFTDDGVFGDGSTFTWSLGEGSTLELFVLEPRELELEARLRPYRIDGPPLHVGFELNGHDAVRLELEDGMQTYHLSLPAETVVAGWNVLRLENIYPDNLPPGPADLGPPGTAWDHLEIDGGGFVGSPERIDDALFIPFGAEVSYVVELAGTSLLQVEELASSRFGGRLQVFLRTAHTTEPRREESVGAHRWGLATELGETSEPTLALLTLSARGTAGDGEGLALVRPRLVSRQAITSQARRSDVLRRVAGVEAGVKGREIEVPEMKAGTDIIVYLVDTLRADHLGAYGYPGDTSPAIDAFAEEAVLFENGQAQSSWTRATVASILTGRTPGTHGVLRRDDALAEEAQTLAESLRAAGYATAAFVTNGNGGAAFGFGQGFDVFELLHQKKNRTVHASAEDVRRAAFTWLDTIPPEQPVFLYLHVTEPHAPYAPPADLAPAEGRDEIADRLLAGMSPEARRALDNIQQQIEGRFGKATARFEIGSIAWMNGLGGGLLPADPEHTAELVALYDAEIRAVDRAFGQFLEDLATAGRMDGSLIAFLADHGEEFFDHGGWEHGHTLYAEQLHVPFILRFPGGPRGLRVPEGGRQIDLLPTALEAAGLEVPEGVEGTNLAEQLHGVSPPSLALMDLDGRRGESLVAGRYKLLCTEGSCRLFDLVEDPGEHHDLTRERPVVAAYLERRLRQLTHAGAGLQAVEAEVDEELAKQLRALGYLD